MNHQELVLEIERRVATKFGGEASASEIQRSFRHNKKHKDAVTNAINDMLEVGTSEQVAL